MDWDSLFLSNARRDFRKRLHTCISVLKIIFKLEQYQRRNRRYLHIFDSEFERRGSVSFFLSFFFSSFFRKDKRHNEMGETKTRNFIVVTVWLVPLTDGGLSSFYCRRNVGPRYWSDYWRVPLRASNEQRPYL